MDLNGVIQLVTDLRGPLLHLGLTQQQLAYNRKRVDAATREEILDAFYFLQEIKDIHLAALNNHIKKLPESQWKYYAAMHFGKESGIWEVTEKLRLEKEIIERWKDRPRILTRKPDDKSRAARKPSQKSRKKNRDNRGSVKQPS